ncbi:MAG: FIG188645: PAP/25A core domain:DNA polymerase, beta-like region [Olavius algarvensis Gamma 1 endosymbiont]|nr:MAG: FIG188645: PAP/25A core domain:DNA polymerase, beta-like region [Olavius algarvensis Gamma 1 endosymbiont]
MDRDAIPSDLRDHREEIRGRYRIERLGLFGSAARDELTESSDVDVLVTLSLGQSRQGRRHAQHKGVYHTGSYPLSTPSTGSTLSTIDLFPLITL